MSDYPKRYANENESPFILAKNKRTGELYRIYWDQECQRYTPESQSMIWDGHLRWLILKATLKHGGRPSNGLLMSWVANEIHKSNFWEIVEVVKPVCRKIIIH